MRRSLVSRLLYMLDGFGRERQVADTASDAPQPAPDIAVQVPLERPEGLIVWMHLPDAAHAGPLPALAQELSRLRGEPVHALLTSSRGRSPSGIATAVTTVGVPADSSGPVRDFFEHWSPDLGIVLGLPDRPALLEAARARGMPLFLAFPERGIAERRIPMLPASLLHLFDACFAPSGEDARLLRAALRDENKVITTGPFSDTALTLPCDEAELSRISHLLSSRPVWMAHHPRNAELPAIEAGHRVAARSAHRLLLIVVPAPDQSAEEIAGTFEREGWRTARRAAGEDPTSDIQVFIADGEDDAQVYEEEIWFRIAPIVFSGGTLAGGATSDPFRAAAHGTAIVHGPETSEGSGRFLKLRDARATEPIQAPEELGPTVSRLLSPDLAAELALAGWSVVSESAHVIDRMARMMDEAIDAADAHKAMSDA